MQFSLNGTKTHNEVSANKMQITIRIINFLSSWKILHEFVRP